MCDGQPASAGEPGEIFLKGPTITPGYADRPDATAQVLHDGWLSTGDIGYLDEEGYLYVLDRGVNSCPDSLANLDKRRFSRPERVRPPRVSAAFREVILPGHVQ
jgi:acyl-CoA synthetase (AMP-forming)/AMP-acid ligase II